MCPRDISSFRSSLLCRLEVTWSLSSSEKQTMTQLVPVVHYHAKALNQLVPGDQDCAGRPSARPWRPGLCWQTVSSSLASRIVLADRQLVPGVPDCAGRRSARSFRPGLCWQEVSSSLASRIVLAWGQLVHIVPESAGRRQLVHGAPGCADRWSARPFCPGLCWQMDSSSLASRIVLTDAHLVLFVLCWQEVSSSLAPEV